MKIKIINPIEFPNWNRYIAEFDEASIFHTSNWASVLSEAYNYVPKYFTAFQDGFIIGCIPIMEIKSVLTGQRGVSLPFTDECQRLGNDSETDSAIWNHLKHHGKKSNWNYIELRGTRNNIPEAPASDSFALHTLDLNTRETDLLKRLRDSTRRNIKNASQRGVTIQSNRSLTALKAFYRLNCRTRRRHGVPPQPHQWFISIYERILATNKGFILSAIHTGAVIAAAVIFHFNKTVTFKYGASIPNQQHLRANNLLIWEAIKWGIEKGFKRFNFGRTDMNNHGLLQFKRGWGAVEETLNYYQYNLKNCSFRSETSKFKSSYPILKIMPLPLLKISGQILYRHIG